MLVILQRPFFCKSGRFRPDPNNLKAPVEIPDCEERFLPKDAVIVKDKQPALPLPKPKRGHPNDELHAADGERAAAEDEGEAVKEADEAADFKAQFLKEQAEKKAAKAGKGKK